MKLLVAILALLAMPACTVKVYELPPGSVAYQPMMYQPAPVVYYGWHAHGCINLNPNVCKSRRCR